jgi:hypothetical protein
MTLTMVMDDKTEWKTCEGDLEKCLTWAEMFKTEKVFNEEGVWVKTKTGWEKKEKK